jgi:hypothetical protein
LQQQESGEGAGGGGRNAAITEKIVRFQHFFLKNKIKERVMIFMR